MVATPEAALVAAIAADPDDPAPQLVIADWLLSNADPRGELIVLDHAERTTPGGLVDPEAIERLLFLAAEYTFPCARDAEPLPLEFRLVRQRRVRYELNYNGASYRLDYDEGILRITTSVWGTASVGEPSGLVLQKRRRWTEGETVVILRIVGEAIRYGTPFPHLRFPWTRPLPVYDGGPLRVYRVPGDFIAAYGLADDRYGLAARDYFRWNALWQRLRRIGRPDGGVDSI